MSLFRQTLRFLKALTDRKLTTYGAQDNILVVRESAVQRNANDAADYYMNLTDLESQIVAAVPAAPPTGEITLVSTITVSLDDVSFMGPSGGPQRIHTPGGQAYIPIAVTVDCVEDSGGTLTGVGWNASFGIFGQPAIFQVDAGIDAANLLGVGGSPGEVRMVPSVTDDPAKFTTQRVTRTDPFELYLGDDPGTSGDTANTLLRISFLYININW